LRRVSVADSLEVEWFSDDEMPSEQTVPNWARADAAFAAALAAAPRRRRGWSSGGTRREVQRAAAPFSWRMAGRWNWPVMPILPPPFRPRRRPVRRKRPVDPTPGEIV
jgi:hypothetical protein